MLQTVIALLLLGLVVFTLAQENSSSASGEEGLSFDKIICNQLANFDRLQAATAFNGTLHVLICNSTTSTTDYHRLPLDNTTVDNIEGRLTIKEPGDFEANVTVETVSWLRWMAKLEKEDNNKQQLMGQIQFAMLNVSKPFVGALVRLQDGRQYCSVSVDDEKANPVDCGLPKGDMVVGSVGSADSEETKSMLISVKTEKNGEQMVQLKMAKYNNLLSEDVMSTTSRFGLSNESPLLLFGFSFAGTVG
ncbi:hypothetical protein TYRP_017522 [Tyrophagus putrescentiae]|nr:hypothetical protein TYRP_017522 [Tyrophagus putrescentiae]